MDTFWEVFTRVGAVIAFASLVLGVWLTLRTMGFFLKRDYTVESRYFPPYDSLGFAAMPHFVLNYRNDGEVPVVFSNFELLLPRKLFDDDGRYISHLGAELFIDKRFSSRIGENQELAKIDYRTNKVRLAPGESHMDFFDLGAFVPDLDPSWLKPANLPDPFEPVLAFGDSFGHEYHCDAVGIQKGRYEHPELPRLLAKGGRRKVFEEIRATRGRLGRRWSIEKRSRDLEKSS